MQHPLVGVAAFRDSIHSLLDSETRPWASTYVPIEQAWSEAKANGLRLRALIDRVRDEAARLDLPSAVVDAMLAPARDLLDSPSLVGTPSFGGDVTRGLALFLAPTEHTVLRLPFAPSFVGQIDDRVHVRPLWRHFEPDGRFYVLGLSAGGAALYRASRYDMEPVPLEGPTTLEEVLQFDEHTRSIRYHTKTPPGSGGGRRPAIFYGQEDAGDQTYVKEGLLRFFRTLDTQVREVLAQDSTPAPLVLAGIEGLRGLYRQVSQYQHLLEEAIEESVIAPETREWNDTELHLRAWDLVRPHFDQNRRDAFDLFRAIPERTAANPGSVLLAAVEGRVDTLFVAEDPVVWGVYDESRHTVRIHSDREPGDVELLNAATVAVLQAGGKVYVSDASAVPEGTDVAALLRY